MSVKFYMDEHVPFAITVGLRIREDDVLTAQEDHMEHQPDPALMDRALQLGRVVFTSDSDFLREGHRRQRESVSFSGVVFAHMASLSIGSIVTDLHLIAQCAEPEELANQVLYLPL